MASPILSGCLMGRYPLTNTLPFLF